MTQQQKTPATIESPK